MVVIMLGSPVYCWYIIWWHNKKIPHTCSDDISPVC